MLKMMRNGLLRYVRRIAGTEQVSRQQNRQHQYLLSLGNAMKYFFTDPEKVKGTAAYKRCAEMVSLLSPMDVEDAKYIRLGKDCDGGYVMLDFFKDTKIEAAYSFGIGDDVSWDEAVADRGVDVFMYDHMVKGLPKSNPKFHFFRTGVTGYEKRRGATKTLSELIARNNHSTSKALIMKMDIEGCEWDVLKETPSNVIDQFCQFVVEFHGLAAAVYKSKCSEIFEVLQKINQTHQIVHVHANGRFAPLWIGDLVLASPLEATYVRRADFKDRLTANTRQFPTEIDQPTLEYLPDIYLGDFSIGKD